MGHSIPDPHGLGVVHEQSHPNSVAIGGRAHDAYTRVRPEWPDSRKQDAAPVRRPHRPRVCAGERGAFPIGVFSRDLLLVSAIRVYRVYRPVDCGNRDSVDRSGGDDSRGDRDGVQRRIIYPWRNCSVRIAWLRGHCGGHCNEFWGAGSCRGRIL